MQILKQRILEDGVVIGDSILKVDNFLNHQIDVELLDEIGREFHKRFGNIGLTKILTVEASGISVACATAREYKIPVLFAKKGNVSTQNEGNYCSKSFSFTKNEEYTMNVSKKYIGPDDKILIIDDFLANGLAIDALLEIVEQSGAQLAGIGIVREKDFQAGGRKLREKGYHLESLARIASMGKNGIVFA